MINPQQRRCHRRLCVRCQRLGQCHDTRQRDQRRWSQAFDYCSSLTAIIVDEHNPAFCSVGGVLFDEKHSQRSFNIQRAALHPPTHFPTASPQSRAMRSLPARDLISLTIANSVTNIGEWAFFLCTSLTQVAIGDHVATIGQEAFRTCTSLTSVTISDGVTNIGGRAGRSPAAPA